VTELLEGLILLLLLLASATTGLFVRPLLSAHHTTHETFDLMRLVSTMLLTFAAIVLGLLTTSAKNSFDQIGNDLRGLGSQLIRLDTLMREYGPETDPTRALLRRYTAAAIASSWADEPPPPGNYDLPKLVKTDSGNLTESPVLGDLLVAVELQLRRLAPEDSFHQRLAADTLSAFQTLTQRRWKLIEEAHSSISIPFYVVLVFWLVVVFATFGLSAPRNLLVYLMLGLGALSIASALFVILDLDAPIGGLFSVSSEPLRVALEHLNQ
jgi:hypothetical protein